MATAMMRPRMGSSMALSSQPLGGERIKRHHREEADADDEKDEVLHGSAPEIGSDMDLRGCR